MSPLMPQGAQHSDERCWCCGVPVAYPLVRLVCDTCSTAGAAWATVAPLLERWRIALIPRRDGSWDVLPAFPYEGPVACEVYGVPFHALPQAIREVSRRCDQAQGEGGP